MPGPTDAILVAFGAAGLVGLCGAAFAFAVASVWRAMHWAPINISVTVNNRED